MDALHGGDDTELTEAWNVVAVDVLRVFNAPPKVLAVPVVLDERLFEQIQHLAVGAITNGVQAELISVIDRELRGGAGRIEVATEAGAVDEVGVRRE